MQSINRFALKEWASVCAALAHGRQSILLRKGGIAEETDGFRVEHREFWLYPTRFHQSSDELSADAADLPDDPLAAAPRPGTVQLALYGVVDEVFHVADAARLDALDGLHVLALSTLLKRFEYRAPGLNVLLVRIYRRGEPFELSESPHFAGCKSWVDLRNKLPTAGLVPAISEDSFGAVSANLRERLQVK
ncbi:MAG: DUF1802 family protein [Planctomycetaceae bacterium]|nr:DUF1802 family protein [Planctomycetaceae bacterium]